MLLLIFVILVGVLWIFVYTLLSLPLGDMIFPTHCMWVEKEQRVFHGRIDYIEWILINFTFKYLQTNSFKYLCVLITTHMIQTLFSGFKINNTRIVQIGLTYAKLCYLYSRNTWWIKIENCSIMHFLNALQWWEKHTKRIFIRSF